MLLDIILGTICLDHSPFSILWSHLHLSVHHINGTPIIKSICWMVKMSKIKAFSRVRVLTGARGHRSGSEAKTDQQGCYSWRRSDGVRDSNGSTS